MNVLHDQIRDRITVEAVVDLRDTRCLRVSDSLAVDVRLGSGVIVEGWFAPLDEVGLRYYATARVADRPGEHSADVPGARLDDQSSELGLLDGRPV